jgi:hypothetical protein
VLLYISKLFLTGSPSALWTGDSGSVHTQKI